MKPLNIIFSPLYIVLFLHQTATFLRNGFRTMCCISFYSYIKPQLVPKELEKLKGCISFYSYIKPQLSICFIAIRFSCISFYSYIKPQLRHGYFMHFLVVYRSIPTSNRNCAAKINRIFGLYIVLFLHQTATLRSRLAYKSRCISFYSYIKPQPNERLSFVAFRCISFYSYIKPQLWHIVHFLFRVVYRSIPTSNRNQIQIQKFRKLLYIVLFLHQTATCVPGHSGIRMLYIVLFLHQTATFW